MKRPAKDDRVWGGVMAGYKFNGHTRRLLAENLDILERVGCQFWACRGPEKKPQAMVTCYRCSMIRRLRKLLEDNKGVIIDG